MIYYIIFEQLKIPNNSGFLPSEKVYYKLGNDVFATSGLFRGGSGV